MGRFLESIRRHLRLRLIIWLFVVPAPPLLLTVWFAQQGYSNLETEQKDAQQALAIRALDTLDRILYERYGDARVFAQLPVVRALETDRIAEVAGVAVTTYAPYYALIVVADREGIIRAVNPVDGSGRPISSEKLIGQSVSGQPWFEQALAAQSVLVEDLHEDTLAGQVYGREGAVVMTFSAPIRGDKAKGREGTVVGVWSARVPERAIAQALEGESSRSSRAGDIRMALFTKDGRRVAGALQSPKKDVPDSDDRPLASAASSGFRDYPGVGWTLSLFAPVEGAPPRTPFSLPVAGGIVITIIAGMVFLARATNRVVLDPLYALAYAAESLKRGEPGVLPQEPGRLDVIGVLQKELADMVEALKARETEARTAEAQYRAAKDQLASVLEHAPDPIIFTNLSGHITLYNKGAERVLGYAASDVLGKPVTDLYLDPSERAAVLAELDAKGDAIGHEVRLRTRDGRTVTLSLTLSPCRDAEGQVIGTVGVSKDITAAKLLEQALRTSNQELEGFVYVISHDLQTPLRGIHGFADLLVKRMKDKLDERERHYVARIQAGAQRMATLINDLLEYSRLERMAQPFEKVRMKDVLDQALRDLDHLIRDSRAVVQCDGPLPVVWGDRTRLGLVWTNLLTNAIKYARPDEAPRISIRCREDEREFVFQCQDNGIGISPEFHTHIFDLFRRLHTTDKFEGTGVGLAIVKRVMELHHGRIWVESAAGQGATFRFTLPKTQPNITQALSGHRNPATIKETAS